MATKPERWLLAEALAHEDGETQAQFFNAFFAELQAACRGNDRRHTAQSQTPYIAEYLDAHARDCIKALAGDVEYEDEREKERAARWAPAKQEFHDLERRIGQARETLAELERAQDERKAG
jgi:hypothetical protein